jgi:hypothetical protein
MSGREDIESGMSVLFSSKSNVCPCVPRRTLSRDEFIVLESQVFS